MSGKAIAFFDEEKITPSQTSSSREQSNENSKDGESR